MRADLFFECFFLRFSGLRLVRKAEKKDADKDEAKAEDNEGKKRHEELVEAIKECAFWQLGCRQMGGGGFEVAYEKLEVETVGI